jgi:hypothetical protein
LATVRSEADNIRREMAEIRSQLHQDMREVVSVATTATDWRTYVRGHRWLAIGLAFSCGYLLVPRRSRLSRLVVRPPAIEMGNSQAIVEPEKPGRSTLLRRILDLVGPIAVRAGQSYAINYVENLLANHQTGPQPKTSARPASLGPASRSEERDFATRR